MTRYINTFFMFLLCICIAVFSSCSNEDNVSMNSSAKLLPSKITTEYGASARRIYSYEYDNQNRLIAYKETRFYGNDISMEDIEINCKITYNSDNKIDSLIIKPRLLNTTSILPESMYALVNDTILFEYNESKVKVTQKGNVREEILTDAAGKVVLHRLNSYHELSNSKTVSYEYDNRGNILRYIVDDGTEAVSPYQYMYDKKNGIFKNVNTPQWFLAIMLNQDFYFVNNYRYSTGSNGDTWIMVSEYNSDDYPTFVRTQFEGNTHIIGNEMPTSIDYIMAK